MAKLNFRQINATTESEIPGLTRVINAIQGNIASNFNLLQQIPFLDGLLLELNIVSGDNVVAHKLGRQPLGYLILSQSAGITVRDNIQSGATTTNFVLNSTDAAAIKLWVF